MKILREVLSLPTASFCEEHVVEYVRQFASHAGLDFKKDAGGNVYLSCSRGRDGHHWVFAAHMDHPGFVVRMRRGRTVWAEFRGGVRPEYFRKGARVRLLAPGGDIVATIIGPGRVDDHDWRIYKLALPAPADVPDGTIGMWDFTPVRIRGNTVSSRACDDLGGVASVLCTMQEIASSRLNVKVTGLLTRAEESGFVGALAACRNGSIPAGADIVAIETSKAQPAAKLGGGAVIRVGDAMRMFNPSLTGYITAVARDLAKKHKSFRASPQLMPGGVCESSVYSLLGYRAAGLCVPLGNYHNMGPKNRVAVEKINLCDFESLVRLLVGIAADKRTPAQIEAAAVKRLGRIYNNRKKYLR